MGLSDVWKNQDQTIEKNQEMVNPRAAAAFDDPYQNLKPLDDYFVDEEDKTLELGNLIGNRYELKRVIHEGGMGKVFLARHLERNIPVAVKTIRMDTEAGDQAKQLFNRFRREARGMSLLSHPNIVRILGCDLSDPTQAYIVMEYVDGITLWDYVQRRKKGAMIHFFLTSMGQLCSAFELVHSKGIVHRDIKPNNIMLTKVGGQLRVKLLDLGLIFFERAFSVTAELKLTRQGQLVGTPAYMSPEQCKGEQVTHLSDIYSLGLIAWELLIGKPAFQGKNPAELFVKQLKVKPKPVNLLRPDIPPKIAEAVDKALSKDPSKRPQSSREFFQMMHFSG